MILRESDKGWPCLQALSASVVATATRGGGGGGGGGGYSICGICWFNPLFIWPAAGLETHICL